MPGIDFSNLKAVMQDKPSLTHHKTLPELQETSQRRIEFNEKLNNPNISSDSIKIKVDEEAAKIKQQYTPSSVYHATIERNKNEKIRACGLAAMTFTENSLRKMGMETLANHPGTVLISSALLLSTLAGLLYSYEKNS